MVMLYSSRRRLVNSRHTRRTFLQTSLLTGAVVAGANHASGLLSKSKPAQSSSSFGEATPPPKPAFPVADLHVHLSDQLSIQQAVALGKQRGIQIGIVEHPGPGYRINTDADLKQYIDTLRPYPVRVGLQPVYPGWSKAFSRKLLDQLDYVLMDALTMPRTGGGWLAIWQIDTMVDDGDAFIEPYLDFIEQILRTEPIHIFGWPTFLPVPIARQYSDLWTYERMQRIIDAAVARNIAIEINELAHVPNQDFITMAKRYGLKFTFGTDSRTPQSAAHLYYCYQMAQRCGLTEADMFVPKKK